MQVIIQFSVDPATVGVDIFETASSIVAEVHADMRQFVGLRKCESMARGILDFNGNKIGEWTVAATDGQIQAALRAAGMGVQS